MLLKKANTYIGGSPFLANRLHEYDVCENKLQYPADKVMKMFVVCMHRIRIVCSVL